MFMSSNAFSLPDRDRRIRIFALALPIIGGMVSQNILNLVDTAMVSHYGNAALSAVGLGGFANFMCQALILGISVGVQAIASRRKGEGRESEMASPLNSAIVLVLCIAPLLSVLLYFAVPKFYPYLNSDLEVIRQGVPYLQIRNLAITFVGINFAFRGYWNAIDLSKLYMSTLIVMHISNIILNYILIFGKFGFPEMGVAGAATATSISTVIGTICYFFLGFSRAKSHGFFQKKPKLNEMTSLISLSIPNGFQQLFFAAGFTTLYWIIGQVGTAELAAANVLINITLIAILPGIAFGIAAATLVGQALGKGSAEDAKRWGWDVVKIGSICIAVLGLPMFFFTDYILQPFVPNETTMAIARMPMKLIGLLISLDTLGLVLMNALLGAGAARQVMIVSISVQWLIFLPAVYLVGPILKCGLMDIWVLQIGHRVLQSFIFVWLWQKGKWAKIKL